MYVTMEVCSLQKDSILIQIWGFGYLRRVSLAFASYLLSPTARERGPAKLMLKSRGSFGYRYPRFLNHLGTFFYHLLSGRVTGLGRDRIICDCSSHVHIILAADSFSSGC
jgi:hypothetical protein